MSTAQQVLGDGLDAQAEAVDAWAARNGHELVALARDEGRSGALEATARPGLLGALRLLEVGDADLLAVQRLDRLARALHVQEAVLSRAWEVGGRVHEVVGDREVLQDDPDDPMRTFVRQVMGAAAQLERGMIVARLQGGRRRKRDQGGYVGGGSAPYGFERVGHDLVEVPAEQGVIGLMEDLRRRNGLTFRQIAERLNAQGIEARRGGPWGQSSVRSVLRRADGGHSKGCPHVAHTGQGEAA